MSDQLTFVVSPHVIGAVLGFAMFNLSMALTQSFIIATIALVVVSLAFPNFYVDRSPRCVYCFNRVATGAQFCPHCGRIQPES
ncbi:MAG: hypothetical protein ACXAE3_13645 [Candidatus Kariarchaeaceae archaeon]|jgi:hypothetical protein